MMYPNGAKMCLCPTVLVLDCSRTPDILHDVLNYLEQGSLMPNISQAVSLSQVPELMPSFPQHDMGKIVMVNS